MIPTHDLTSKTKKDILVNPLVHLTHYDAGAPHRHNYFEFFVFEKGGGRHLIDFVDFPIRDRSIHIVAPGQVHQVQRALDSNGHVFIFGTEHFSANSALSEVLFTHICEEVGVFSPTYDLSEVWEDRIACLTQMAFVSYTQKNPSYNEQVFHLLSLLLIECKNQRKANFLPENEDKNGNLYLRFRRLVNEEFRQMKKVKEYANKLGCSEKALNEIVQNRTGKSVSQLIYGQLILEAKRLLKTGISNKEVAYQLNFEDPSHFSKFFKSQTDLTPSDYLKIPD